MKFATTATCPECHRVFDLFDEDDAGEWHYGHDCEEIRPSPPPPTEGDPT